MFHLGGFPPAVEQRRDPARLGDRHVRDDPCRAVAHRNGDAVALGNAARGEPLRQAVGDSVEIGERQPFVAGDEGLVRSVQCAEGFEKPRKRRRQIGNDRPAKLVLSDDQPAPGARFARQFLVEAAVELAGHAGGCAPLPLRVPAL